ncbi:MAG: hypothetical protein ACXWYJ_05060 [Actinomycetota bacterium]
MTSARAPPRPSGDHFELTGIVLEHESRRVRLGGEPEAFAARLREVLSSSA